MATLSESRPRDPSTATNPGVSPAARTRLVVASQALEIKQLQDRLDAKDRQLAQAQAKDLQRQTEATAELAAARANERRVTAQAAVLGDRVRDLEQHVGPDAAAPGQSQQKSLTHHTANGTASNATVGGQPRENLVQQLRDDLRQARLQNQSLLQEREIAMQKLVQERSTVARLDAELQDVKEKLNNALDANKNTGGPPAGSGSVAASGAAAGSFGHLHQNSTVGVGLTSILGKVDGVTQTDAALTAEDVEVIVVDAVRCAQQTQQALRRHPPNVAAQLPNRVSSFVASTANATPARHGFPTEDASSSTPIEQQAISTSTGEHQQKPPMSRFASVLPQTTYESDQVISLLQHHMQSCEDLLQMHRGAAAQEAANIGILQKALQEHLASQVAKLATEQEKYKRMMNPGSGGGGGGGHGTTTSGGAFSAFSPSNHRSLNRAMGAAATSSTFTTQERLHRNATGFASGHATDDHQQRQDNHASGTDAGRASGGRGGSEEYGAWSDGAPGSQSDASDAFGPESKGPRLAAAAASMAKANHAASSQRGHQHRRLPAPTSGQEERPEPLADDSFYPAEPTDMALRRRGHTAPPEHPSGVARQEATEGTIDALGAPRVADDDDASSIMDQGPKLAAVQRPRPAQQEPMYAPRDLDAEVPQTEVIDMDRSVSAPDHSMRGASLRPNGGGGGNAAAGLAASTINQAAGNTVNTKAAMDAHAPMSVSHRSHHREVIDTGAGAGAGAAEYNHHISQPTPPPPPAAALQEVQERQQARRPSSTYPPPSVDDQSSDRFLDSDRFGPHHRTTKAPAGGNADLSRPSEPPHQRFDTGMEKRATADDDEHDEVRKRHDSTQHQPHYQQQHGGDDEGSAQQQRHPYAIGEHQMRQVEWERSQRETSADMRVATDGGMMRTPRPGAPPQQSGGGGNYGGGSIDDGYSDPYAPTLVQYQNQSQRPQDLPLAQSSVQGQTPATPVNPAQATEGAKQKGPSPAERFAQQQQKELSSLRTRLQELQERHDKVKLSGPVPFVPQSTSNSNSRAGSMETAPVHALPLGVPLGNASAASHSGGQYHSGDAAAAAAAAGVPGFGGGAGGAGGVSSGLSFSPNPYIASPSKSERPAMTGPSQMATAGLASTLAARQLGGTLGAGGTPGVAGAVGGEPASFAPPVGMQRAQVGHQPQSVLQQMLSRATAAPDAAQRTARPE